MNSVEGRVAHAEDKLAALFKHDVGGARHEVVAGAVGDRSERHHRAGNYEHGVDRVAAGGDGGADVAIRQDFYFRGRAAKQAVRKLSGVARGNAELFGEEALAGFGDDEVDAHDASVFFEQSERLLGEYCPACSSHTNGNGLFFCASHVFRANNFSLAAACGQVKQTRSKLPMREFAAVKRYGSAGTSENPGSGAVRRRLSLQGDRTAEAFAVWGFGIRQSGAPSRSAAGVFPGESWT